MILDTIIDLENKLIKSKRRLPKIIKLNYANYCALIREIESSHFLSHLHGIPIKVLPVNRVIVE